jgi:uncharacterized membrane protein YdjX (TVP38/TMEM64 family)
MMNDHNERIVVLLAVLFVLGAVFGYQLLEKHGILAIVMDPERLRDWITQFGYKGPVVLIMLMAVAIIINPVPSAPIAVAAGAAYGHTWGTIYVVSGATCGALGAFCIARLLGYKLLTRWLGDRVQTGWVGSQNTLTGMVLVSRLIPFISFDLVSYGAGLTPLKAWRFTLATVIGLIPVSFLLTHFGGELASASLDRLLITVLLLGFITAIPVLVHWLWKRHQASQRNSG